MRRGLAILLSAAMLTTLMPVSAFADEELYIEAELADEYVTGAEEDDAEPYKEGSDEEPILDTEDGAEIADVVAEDELTEDSASFEEPLVEEDLVEEGEEILGESEALEDSVSMEEADKEPEVEAALMEESSEIEKEAPTVRRGRKSGERPDPEDIDFELADPIAVGEEIEISLEENGYSVFKFTPEKTKRYAFCSFNNVYEDEDDYAEYDPYAYLLDEERESIRSDDDDGEERNFFLSDYLTEGSTYYFVATSYHANGGETFSVKLIESITITLDPSPGFLYSEDNKTLEVFSGKPMQVEDVEAYSEESGEGAKGFVCWINEDGEEIYNLYEYIPEHDETLKAKFSDYRKVTVQTEDINKGWFIDWDDEGEEKIVSSYQQAYPEGKQISLKHTDIQYDEKLFIPSYYTDEDGTEYLMDEPYRVDGDTVLTIHFAKTCAVTLEAGEGHFTKYDEDDEEYTVPSRTVYVAPGDTFSFEDTGIEYDNNKMKLLGYTAQDGTLYKSDDEVKITEDVTFIAQFVHKIAVTFDPNGGTHYESSEPFTDYLEPGNSFYAYDEEDIEAPGEKQVLAYWEGDDGRRYEPGNSYYPMKDVTLTAVYRQSYTIVLKSGTEGYFRVWENGKYVKKDSMPYDIVAGDAIGSHYIYPTAYDKKRPVLYAYETENHEILEDSAISLYVPKHDGEELKAVYGSAYQVTFVADNGYFSVYDYDEEKYKIVEKADYYVKEGERFYYNNETPTPRTDRSDIRYTGKIYDDEACTREVDLDDFIPDADTTLYFGWVERITLTFEAAPQGQTSGSFGGSTKESTMIDKGTVYGREKIELPSPVADSSDAAFKGWYKDAALTEALKKGDQFSTSTTLYAGYGAAYTVTFDAGEGQFADGSKKLVKALQNSRGLTRPDDPDINDPAKIFYHWEKNGVRFDFDNDLILGDMTLTAVYGDACTVVLDADEGYWDEDDYDNISSDGKLCTEKNELGSKFQIYSYWPEHKSKAFLGWSEVKGDPGAIIEKDMELAYPFFDTTGQKTLYAIYSDYVHVGCQALEGGYLYRWGMTSSSMYIDVTAGEKLDDNEDFYEIYPLGYAGSGKVFDAWYRDQACTQPADLSTLKAEAGLMLYAGFIDGTEVKLALDGGSMTIRERRSYSMSDIMIVPKGASLGDYYNIYTPEKEGYLFDGFYTDAAFTDDSYIGDDIDDIEDYKPQGNVTIFLKWVKGAVVTLHATSRTGSGKFSYLGKDMYSQVIKIGSRLREISWYSILPSDPKRITDGSWYFNEECTKRADFSQTVTGPVELYAGYVTSVPVKLYANGGFFRNYKYVGGRYVESYTDTYEMQSRNHMVIDLDDEERIPRHADDTVTFGGWYLNEECTEPANQINDAYFDVLIGDETELNLYAKWIPNIKVYLHGNGGDFDGELTWWCTMPAGNTLEEVPVPVHDNPDMVFQGFFTAASGGTRVTDFTFAKETDLYAQYKKRTFTVTLDPNGGYFYSGDEVTTPVQFGATGSETIAMIASTYYDRVEKTGYNRFGGWTVSGTVINPDTYVPTKAETLTAQWVETVKVTLSCGDGWFGRTGSSVWMAFPDKNTKLSDFDKTIGGGQYSFADLMDNVIPPEGMEFQGWYTEDGQKVDLDFVPTDNLTHLSARYKVKSEETVEVSSVTLQPVQATLTSVGETLTLVETIKPDNATNKEVEWSSSNPNAATVNNVGVVTAVDDGTATITATAKDGSGKSATATITVKIPTYDFTVTGGKIAGSEKTTDKFRAKAEITIQADAPATGKLFKEWTVSDGVTFATGSTKTAASATVTMPAGAATVTATYEDAPVEAKLVEKVEVTPATATISKLGETATLTALVTPNDADDNTVTWTSSDTAVATVDKSGVVTAVAEGNVKIRATANDGTGKYGEADLTVSLTKYKAAISGGSISGTTNTSYQAAEGEEVKISAGVPAKGKKFSKWTVTGAPTLVSGTWTSESITVTLTQNATFTADFVNIPVEKVTLTADKTKLTAAGETVTITSNVLPVEAFDRSLAWTSSDASVATVDANGKVTAVKSGKVTITAAAKDGSGVKGTIEITVEVATPQPQPKPQPQPQPQPAPQPAAPLPKAADGTATGAGASAKTAAAAITSSNSEEGPSGSNFNLLQARLKKATKNSIALRWKRVSGAKKYIVYGNACGKGKKFQELATVSGTSFTCKAIADGSKLKPKTYYKFMVMAVDEKDVVVATSKTLHITTLGGTNNNYKAVKLKNSSGSIKVKKTTSIKASLVKKGKKAKVHRKVAYESDNPKVATVSKTGKVKGVGPGKCKIYAYAQDGTFKAFKVTVKK